MKIIFLAAGRGKRIFKKIKINKCLISINKKTIIENLIENIPKPIRKNIFIVTGFNKNKIINKTNKYKINFLHNKNYKNTEMVETLRVALMKINDDILISYTDIIYDKFLINLFLKKKYKNITLPIKTNWRKVWDIRGKKAEQDAETLIFKKDKLLEIGGKIQNINTIKAQFMGLLFIPKKKRLDLLNFLSNPKYKKIQTTKLLNDLIKKKMKINVIKTKNKWYEFDDYQDLKNFKKKYKNFF